MRLSVATCAGLLLAASSTLALAQTAEKSGEMGGAQSGAEGTAQGTTGAPGANMPGGTGTGGTGPDEPASATAGRSAEAQAPGTERGPNVASTLPEGQKEGDGFPTAQRGTE